MINKQQNLSEKMFKKDIEKVSVREGFGEGLVEAGGIDRNVVALTADLRESTRVILFERSYPERFFDTGVAEQALVTVASGMAAMGKIPFAASFAVFSPGRNWEQIRTTIALNNVPVKIVGSHAGVETGEDGSSHQALEDIALMRVLPNMVVVAPSDAIQAKKATLQIAVNKKPSYLRLSRPATAVFTTADSPFEIGKANILWESKDPQVAIVACGPLVYEAIKAARLLKKEGVEVVVIDNHTVKPLDEQTIIHAAKISEAVVTVEDHQVAGGMGSAVAEVLAKNYPVPIEFVAMQDQFGESGKAAELLSKYGLNKEGIVAAVKRVIKRKTRDK